MGNRAIRDGAGRDSAGTVINAAITMGQVVQRGLSAAEGGDERATRPDPTPRPRPRRPRSAIIATRINFVRFSILRPRVLIAARYNGILCTTKRRM
jgi:hypothetical protein